MIGEQQLSAVVSECDRIVVGDQPVLAVLDHMVARFVDVLPVNAADVTLLGRGISLRYVVASDDSELRHRRLQAVAAQGPCVVACTSGEPLCIPDLRNDDRFLWYSAAAVSVGLGAVFIFPLRHATGQVGTLDLCRDTPGPLDAQDMVAAQRFADMIGGYLLDTDRRLRAIDEAADDARYDAVTGLPNRMLLRQRLQRASEQVRTSDCKAAVLLIRLNGLAQISRTFGDRIADALLAAAAGRLSRLIRPGDTLARISRDEFAMLCPRLGDRAEVDILASRIDRALATPFGLSRDRARAIQVNVTATVDTAFTADAAGDTNPPDHILTMEGSRLAAANGGAAQHLIRSLHAEQTTERLVADLEALLRTTPPPTAES